MYIHIYVYICIYTHTERERERDSDREGVRERETAQGYKGTRVRCPISSSPIFRHVRSMMCPVTTRLLLLLQSLTYSKQRKKEHISTSVLSLLVPPHACTWVCVRVRVCAGGVCVRVRVRAHACLGVVFDLLYVIKSTVFQRQNKTTFEHRQVFHCRYLKNFKYSGLFMQTAISWSICDP